MFFLENIFVPPIKFHPPTKGGDMVLEHAHTVLLSKIMQSNIRLGDAHLNKKDPSMVLARKNRICLCSCEAFKIFFRGSV
ncbi:DNA-directed RNA polymerase I subunit 1-like isoform X2 [Arachis ipaensis]|uniref:DNA-directed RNA polymerase I subunit 1-like isoform X2 n=1 Tax=Arachis ipaensis TaxID=130454 RepID=UPI000A2B665A|nr:DNA-directed RNA polymerase I subunit 1-like isoform X2 [Arachis ipaensis]